MCHDVGHTSDSSPSPQELEKPLTVKDFEKSNQSPRNKPHITMSPNNGHNSASRLADAGIRTTRETSVRTGSQKWICYKNKELAMFKGTTAQTLRCSVYE
jgi:hypothetical protein